MDIVAGVKKAAMMEVVALRFAEGWRLWSNTVVCRFRLVCIEEIER